MSQHKDKTRDMARSILPSKWEGAAKRRAQAHRKVRRQAHMACKAALYEEDLGESVEFSDPTQEIRSMVSDRRDADKVNPLIRWAEKRTQKLRPEDRLGHLRAILPDGLIGEHALTHLEHQNFIPPKPHQWWRDEKVQKVKRVSRAEVLEALRKLPYEEKTLLWEAVRKATQERAWFLPRDPMFHINPNPLARGAINETKNMTPQAPDPRRVKMEIFLQKLYTAAENPPRVACAPFLRGSTSWSGYYAESVVSWQTNPDRQPGWLAATIKFLRDRKLLA